MGVTFQLINNLNHTASHRNRIISLFNTSDNVLIASPFLMEDFNLFFDELRATQLSEIHLVTTIPPNSREQIKKIEALSSLVGLSIVKSKKLQCKISINNKLHGKVYIFKRHGDYVSAIISSANFTNAGLERNHEWGVEIFDKLEIANLEETIISTIEYSDLTSEIIQEMKQTVEEFQLNLGVNEEKLIELDLIALLLNSVFPFDTSVNYWLKPIGATEFPVEEGRLFEEIEYDLHFSNRRPNSVNLGDIIIAYGVGSRQILSLYRVNSDPQIVSEEDINDEEWYERWPWYVNGINLTPDFGRSWWIHRLYIGQLEKDFLRLDGQNEVTAVGGRSLGALRFGKDKLMLSHEFAKYVINKVMEKVR